MIECEVYGVEWPVDGGAFHTEWEIILQKKPISMPDETVARYIAACVKACEYDTLFWKIDDEEAEQLALDVNEEYEEARAAFLAARERKD